MGPPTSKRIDHIDSIRGVAALAVAYFHAAQYFKRFPSVQGHDGFLSEISYQLSLGYSGVIAFFAISGFVICPTLKGERAAGSRRFLISRFFRLYPPFWTSLLLMSLVSVLLLGKQLDVGQILGNIPMLYSLAGVKPVINVYWTLEVELIFYLLCLLMFLFNGLHKPLVLFATGIVLMGCSELIFGQPGIRNQINVETGTWYWKFLPWNLAIMFWGGLFRIWYDDRHRRVLVRGFSIPVVALVATLLLAILLRPVVLLAIWVLEGNFWLLQTMIPFVLGLGLFIAGALIIKLKNRFLVWLGTISYSIYLLHLVAIQLVHQICSAGATQWMHFHLGVYLLMSIALSILMAGIVYYAIEKPAIRIGRFLQQRWV